MYNVRVYHSACYDKYFLLQGRPKVQRLHTIRKEGRTCLFVVSSVCQSPRDEQTGTFSSSRGDPARLTGCSNPFTLCLSPGDVSLLAVGHRK